MKLILFHRCMDAEYYSKQFTQKHEISFIPKFDKKNVTFQGDNEFVLLQTIEVNF